MMHLDTHVVVWLFAGQLERFPKKACALLEDESLIISPMVCLELQYLYEIGRVTVPSAQIVQTLQASIDLHVSGAPFHEIAMEAISLSWTRDPFDRMIVAQATAEKATLLTKDTHIHSHYKRAFWEKPPRK